MNSDAKAPSRRRPLSNLLRRGVLRIAMAQVRTCSQCEGPLPDDWEVAAGADAHPICPKCAAEHMLRKTQRLKVLSHLLAMYGIDPEDKDALFELERKMREEEEQKKKQQQAGS